MPSMKYDDLSVGSSGTTYVAPANGFFELSTLVSNKTTNCIGIMYSSQGGGFALGAPSYFRGGGIISVRKGDYITIDYQTNIQILTFKFVYAVGTGTLYFKVGNAVTNQELIDIGEVTNALANKVDLDAQNLSNEGTSYISGLGMPSMKYDDLSVGSSGSTYVAPANGYFAVRGKTTASNGWVQLWLLNDNTSGNVMDTHAWWTATNGFTGTFLPVFKGQTMQMWYENVSFEYFRFNYAQGEV
jgi:hypothetical protein